LDSSPNNLPTEPTPLIGREKELAEIKQLLARDNVRLVTLTGPGGAGKTRMALHAGSELVGSPRPGGDPKPRRVPSGGTWDPLYPDGVWFVDLSPIDSPPLVLTSIAQALLVKEAAGES